MALRGLPDLDPSAYLEQARSIAALLGTRVLAVREAGKPVAYAQLDRLGGAAEIAQVFVHPEHRGAGLGTAVTRAAIEAASDPDELLIVADDEGRPKELLGGSASGPHGSPSRCCGFRELHRRFTPST